MSLRPRHLTGLPVAEEDAAVLRRWGVARCHAVDINAYSAGLSRLLHDEAPPPGDARQLIDYIRARFHPSHRELLEDAIALANAAEIAHARDDAWPHDLPDNLIGLLEDVEIHQQREDAVIFPMLMGPASAAERARAAGMRLEHEAVLRRLNALSCSTAGYSAPPQACTAWRLLYVLCSKLDMELRDQIALENEVLFSEELRVFPEETDCSNTTLAPRAAPKTRPWRD